MTGVKLLFWEPGETTARVRTLAGPDEVVGLADELLARYRPTRMLPGIELSDSDGTSLSIAISSSGWALVHTDAEFTQHCTKRADSTDQPSLDVRWEEVTSIPEQWFIPKEAAIAGVARWLTDGTLAPDLPWSQDCF